MMMMNKMTDDPIAAAPSDRITLAADIKNIPEITGFAEKYMKRISCPQHIINDFCIAADEIAANICMYACSSGKAGNITVKCIYCRRKNRVSLIFADSGIPFDPLTVPAASVTADLSERSIGGLGIHIVRGIMNDVSYKHIRSMNILKISKQCGKGCISTIPTYTKITQKPYIYAL